MIQPSPRAATTRYERAIFREVNERMRAVSLGFDYRDHAYRLVCECARPDCVDVVSVPIEVYEETLRHAEHFVVVAGHEHPLDERVLARHDACVVVVAGATAHAA